MELPCRKRCASKQRSKSGSCAGVLKDYIAIARPDHWFKNIFMLPGIALGFTFAGQVDAGTALFNSIIAIMSTCLIASANYTINEWLDQEFDRHHPVKKYRPSAVGKIKAQGVYLQWLALSVVGLGLGSLIGTVFVVYAVILLVMGVLYNVKPIRTKDRKYLDTLSESVNNPLRFMLGWAAVAPDIIPPSSILITYWMGGAYLMAIKRYAEYRFIGDAEVAGSYRRSFRFYNEETLLLSAFFYALTSAFFLGVFLVKYRIEYILAIPFLAMAFVWYLRIGMRKDSVTQNPEKLYREYPFLFYVFLVCILIAYLSVADIASLEVLLEAQYLRLD